jgi:hypothetical protein
VMDSYELEERAAIKEFDGNMSRAEAERQAKEESCGTSTAHSVVSKSSTHNSTGKSSKTPVSRRSSGSQPSNAASAVRSSRSSGSTRGKR